MPTSSASGRIIDGSRPPPRQDCLVKAGLQTQSAYSFFFVARRLFPACPPSANTISRSRASPPRNRSQAAMGGRSSRSSLIDGLLWQEPRRVLKRRRTRAINPRTGLIVIASPHGQFPTDLAHFTANEPTGFDLYQSRISKKPQKAGFTSAPRSPSRVASHTVLARIFDTVPIPSD